MATDAKTDELEVVTPPEADGLEVTIVDDTPAADQGRKPLGKDVLAEDDDEAIRVNEKFQKRLGEVRHQAHDERRAKEAALRERDEAVSLARQSLARSQQLEQQLTFGEASYAGEAKDHATLSVDAAKAKYRKAYESGDPEALTDAATELSAAQVRASNVNSWQQQAARKAQNALQQQTNDVASQATHQGPPAQQQSQAAKPDARAVAWGDANPWYGKDPVMTSLAYGVHEKLTSEGVDPVTDADEYYGRITSEVKQRFPEYSWDDSSEGTPARTAKKPAANVAAVQRTAPARNKVVLTASQVSIARQLNISNEAYARELLKAQNSGEA